MAAPDKPWHQELGIQDNPFYSLRSVAQHTGDFWFWQCCEQSRKHLTAGLLKLLGIHHIPLKGVIDPDKSRLRRISQNEAEARKLCDKLSLGLSLLLGDLSLSVTQTLGFKDDIGP